MLKDYSLSKDNLTEVICAYLFSSSNNINELFKRRPEFDGGFEIDIFNKTIQQKILNDYFKVHNVDYNDKDQVLENMKALITETTKVPNRFVIDSEVIKKNSKQECDYCIVVSIAPKDLNKIMDKVYTHISNEEYPFYTELPHKKMMDKAVYNTIFIMTNENGFNSLLPLFKEMENSFLKPNPLLINEGNIGVDFKVNGKWVSGLVEKKITDNVKKEEISENINIDELISNAVNKIFSELTNEIFPEEEVIVNLNSPEITYTTEEVIEPTEVIPVEPAQYTEDIQEDEMDLTETEIENLLNKIDNENSVLEVNPEAVEITIEPENIIKTDNYKEENTVTIPLEDVVNEIKNIENADIAYKYENYLENMSELMLPVKYSDGTTSNVLEYFEDNDLLNKLPLDSEYQLYDGDFGDNLKYFVSKIVIPSITVNVIDGNIPTLEDLIEKHIVENVSIKKSISSRVKGFFNK